METSDLEEIEDILKELQNITHLPGPIQQKILRFKADTLLDKPDEEIKMILNLVESHTPGLTLRANIQCDSFAYEQEINGSSTKEDFDSISYDVSNIDHLFHIIKDLPKEWTVIQLTPQFSGRDIFAINSDDLLLNGVHITVFDCGTSGKTPYCVTIPGGNANTIRGDMKKLKNNLKDIYSIPLKKVTDKMSSKSKKAYHMRRIEMEDFLEGLVREIEDSWLGPWKCLLIGKYVDNSLETKINELVKEFLQKVSFKSKSQKVCNILVQAAKNIDESLINKYSETILEYCCPSEKLESSWKSFWKKQQLDCHNQERHPVILIVDEVLDSFPWEMISTLNGQPSSRVSSLNQLYTIYKTHKDTIIDGYKLISDYRNGTFISNPGLDLQLMEKRLKSFFDYWLPEWKGSAGQKPNSQEFLQAVTSAEIFCYSGHGSGAQYCSSDKIQKEKINSAVFLFGCGSSQLVEQGPSVEMYGVSQMYSLASCPCLIGMLWVVTDIDTDLLTTNFLSTWIPNATQKPWHFLNEREWIDNGIITMDEVKLNEPPCEIFSEQNLLKALCIAKNKMKNLCNRAAVVARGIPVKLKVN